MTEPLLEQSTLTSLEKKLNFIYSLTRSKIDNKKTDCIREEFIELLNKLSNPHRSIPPTIHVAGTNGKGSVIAFLKSVLIQAGYKVHVFTSPHLIKFNERYVISNKEISDEKLEEIIDQISNTYDISKLTFFEMSTAIAFLAFSQNMADITLLETGVGGKYDCTNVITNPALSIITSISYDHTEYLGNTIPQIASEKAGIIKPNIPCVVSPQKFTQSAQQIKNGALIKNSPVWIENENWWLNVTGQSFSINAGNNEYGPYYLNSLLGEHQVINAGTAIMALKALKNSFPVLDTDIQKGLNATRWPARLQKVLAGQKLEIWVDGGHNKDAGEALSKQAKRWHKLDNFNLHIILSMMARKDPRSFLAPLIPFAESITLLSLEKTFPDSLPNQQCLEKIKGLDVKSLFLADDLEEAIKNICMKYREQENRILITGSLYLAGYALQHLNQGLLTFEEKP